MKLSGVRKAGFTNAPTIRSSTVGPLSPDDDLLLISPTQLPNLLIEATSDDPELRHHVRCDTVAAGTRHDPPLREAVEDGERQVLAHAQIGHEAARMAVFRHVRHALPEGCVHLAHLNGLAVQ